MFCSETGCDLSFDTATFETRARVTSYLDYDSSRVEMDSAYPEALAFTMQSGV